METQKQIQLLRHHLFDMSRLAHRAVDYAIKGYRLGSPEFCRFVRRGDRQLAELRRRITDLCQKLMMKEGAVGPESLTNANVTDPDVRFAISALRICDALHATCTAAAEIAHHTMILLEESCRPASDALEKLSRLANRLMCLSIVALFKKQNHHAQTILRNRDTVAQLSGRASDDLRSNIDGRTGIPVALQLAITNSLTQIAGQAHAIAETIIFWLEGLRYGGYALESGAIVQPSTGQ